MRIQSCSELVRPPVFLFPGRTPDKPIEPTVLHAACRSAVKAAGLDKRVSVHVLLVDYHERHVGKLLKKLGFSPMSARPRHPKQGARIVEVPSVRSDLSISFTCGSIPRSSHEPLDHLGARPDSVWTV